MTKTEPAKKPVFASLKITRTTDGKREEVEIDPVIHLKRGRHNIVLYVLKENESCDCPTYKRLMYKGPSLVYGDWGGGSNFFDERDIDDGSLWRWINSLIKNNGYLEEGSELLSETQESWRKKGNEPKE